ncbi:hypothetical protein COCCADRAFT_84853, partial [Bipolaris zeicola 26-R-13]
LPRLGTRYPSRPTTDRDMQAIIRLPFSLSHSHRISFFLLHFAKWDGAKLMGKLRETAVYI